jgi:CelD/BcsL family acetyltransferase involved in cellulose biosynthesis
MNGPTQPQPVEVRVVSDEAGWDDLAPGWSDLFDASPRASTPLHFHWLRTWWRVYGPHYARPGGLWIITLWRGPRLVGVLPLYLTAAGGFAARRLRFLSTGEAEHEETNPDYLDLLCLPGEEAACARAVRGFLARAAWDHLDLLDLPDTSPLLGEGGFADGAGGARVLPRGECPVANLTGGFEAYLGRLSANGRQQARRLVREAEKAPGAAFELADAPQADEFFDDLVRLHQERWAAQGKPGCFAAPRFTEFHRALVGGWLPHGRAVLARLSTAGRPAAVLYGFVTGSKFDFYQSGVRMDAPGLRSPGNQAHLLLMRALAGRGIGWYDFLRG